MARRQVDLEAFATEQGQSLHRLAFLLTGGNTEDAEDIVSAVLARLVARGLDGLTNPVAYARRAVVNEHNSLLRRRRAARRWASRQSSEPASPDPAPVERLAVLVALRSIRPRERAAIVLRYYADLPDEEIAKALGCTRATVRSLVHRALPRLREQLAEHDSPGVGQPPAPPPATHEEYR